MENPPRISFCTTCMSSEKGNYLERLKQTLPQNIEDTKDYPNAQFVVLNYGTNEHTHTMRQWVQDNFSDEIASGKLKYVEYPAAETFKVSHAKNIASRMADGDIVCGIDSDQFIGKGFAQFVADAFHRAEKSGRRIFLRHSTYDITTTNEHNDALGKIAMKKGDFYTNRGYDEQIVGWAGDDGDLMAKMMVNGMKHVPIPMAFANGISHDDQERLENLDDKARSITNDRLASIRGNDQRSAFTRVVKKGGRVIQKLTKTCLHERNPEGFGMGEVYVNFSDTPVTLGPPQVQDRAPAVLERV